MEIINANISADLCETSLEEGLFRLQSVDKNKVFLIAAIDYKFFDLFQLTEKMNFPIANIDTSQALTYASWLLIDYSVNKIYYSEGA